MHVHHKSPTITRTLLFLPIIPIKLLLSKYLNEILMTTSGFNEPADSYDTIVNRSIHLFSPNIDPILHRSQETIHHFGIANLSPFLSGLRTMLRSKPLIFIADCFNTINHISLDLCFKYATKQRDPTSDMTYV